MNELMKTYCQILSALLFLSVALPAYGQPAGRMRKRPTIVMVISDDHAYQTISAYGSKWMQSPNIDRIAREGVLFKKAYVTHSMCGPSRAVILS